MAHDRQELLLVSLRRLVRRGATPHLRRLVHKARAEDLGAALDELVDGDARAVFRVLLDDVELAAMVAACSDHDRLATLWDGLSADQLKGIFEQLATDDAADILPRLPESMQEVILEHLEDADSEGIEELMTYPADTAGGLMSTEFFALDKELTAREAIVALQENPHAEAVFYVYCVNDEGTLVGVLSLRQLLLVRPATQLREVMNSDVISVAVGEDQEEVAAIVARYDLLAVPVVDEFNKLVGVVTVDDVIDVLQEEAAEDMMLMAGLSEASLTASTPKAVRTRLPWLLAAVVGGLSAAVLISQFQEQLARTAILASFIPVVCGLGGNTGVQASTLVVRGLATGSFVPGRYLAHFASELRVVVIMATICATLAAAASYVLGAYDLRLAGAVGTSVLVVMTFGAMLGTSVPLAADRLGVDPAVATGPVLTTSIDLGGVLVYFLVVSIWMG